MLERKTADYKGWFGPIRLHLTGLTAGQAMVTLLIGALLSFAWLVFLIVVLVLNILDMVNNGVSFWPVLWTVLSSLALISVLTRKA